MFQKVTILIGVFLIILNLKAQNYDSYFGQNETHVIQINNDYTLGMYPHRIDSLSITNEIIDNQNMTLKQVDLFRHYSPDTPLVTFYLREELATGKLWARSDVDGVEYLISDMTLEPGDTTSIFSPYTSYTVDHVNYINGKKHIYFESQYLPSNFPHTVDSDDDLFFIEGMFPFIIWQSAGLQNGFTHGESAPVCIVKDGNQVFSIDEHWEISQSSYSYTADWVTCELIDIYNLSNEHFSKVDFTIYPNPAQNGFNIYNNSLEINQVKIFDINGKHVKTFKNLSETFDISDLSNGLYMLNISTDFGNKTYKLIKK